MQDRTGYNEIVARAEALAAEADRHAAEHPRCDTCGFATLDLEVAYFGNDWLCLPCWEQHNADAQQANREAYIREVQGW